MVHTNSIGKEDVLHLTAENMGLVNAFHVHNCLLGLGQQGCDAFVNICCAALTRSSVQQLAGNDRLGLGLEIQKLWACSKTFVLPILLMIM